MPAPNAPRSREKYVTSGSKGVQKKGSGIGGGPAGSSSGYSGRTGGSGGSGVTKAAAGGGGGLIVLIIIIFFILKGFGGGAGTGTSTPSATGTGTGAGLGPRLATITSDSLKRTTPISGASIFIIITFFNLSNGTKFFQH